MKRQTWFAHLAVVFGLILADQFSKIIALKTITSLAFYGNFFGLVLHQNPGAMLGAFSDLPPVLRIVSLSTGGAFLFFIYLALQYLIPQPARVLRFGMSILLGGIMGNVIDRIMVGSVTDFLLLRAFGKTTPAFNVADAVQWLGYGMIVYSLIRDGSLFWPEKEYRKRIWINPHFQRKYVGTLLVLVGGFTAIMGVFFYTYLKVTIDSLVIGSASVVEEKFLKPFLFTFGIIAAGFILMIFILARILSHRISGPLYAFEKYIEDLLDGKSRSFRLRTGDEFKHLEDVALKLKTRFETETPPPPPPVDPTEPLQ